MTRLGNIGAILCLISSTKFLDSGETEMREEFRCSQAVTYESVEAQLEEGELVTHFEEKRTPTPSWTLKLWSKSAAGLRKRYDSFQNIV